ncbi:MAG: bifunctional precorrin-2 dehydrogenase/sirohydrochlorin ferrochelatase [Deltaproteobacteria bacterium]
MRYLPVSLDLVGRRTIVVGGGSVAARKASSLLAAGASVRVVAGEIGSELRELAASQNSLEIVERDYQAGDLADVLLAFAATDDRSVQKAVSQEASERGVLLNVVDEPEACSFVMPAMLELGRVTVAVSTGGASPALAQRIRDEIAGTLGPEYGTAAEVMASLRLRFERGPARAQAFTRLLQSGLLEALKRGDPARVERMTDSVCAGLTERPRQGDGK